VKIQVDWGTPRPFEDVSEKVEIIMSAYITPAEIDGRQAGP
jgi:hypothetical protein